MVEFALILPVLLVTLFMLVELARLLHAWMAVENGARFGVRYAVTAEYDPTKCDPDCSTEGGIILGRVASIHSAAEAGSASILRDFTLNDVTENGFFKTTVCKEDQLIDPGTPTESFQCVGGVEDPGIGGQTVIVAVEFTHPLITPILTGIVPNIHITSEREAVVETFRVVQAGSGAPGADPPDPPNPCDNIILHDLSLTDRSKNYPDRMWKLSFALYNNNYFDGTITGFTLDWDDKLDLTRWVYRHLGVSSPRINMGGKQTGPLTQASLPFPKGQPPLAGMPTMYGELCVNMNSSYCKDDEDKLKDAAIIPPGTYKFTVTGTFDFGEYGTCPLGPLVIDKRADPKTGGGGGGGGDPWDPPDPPPGGGDDPPGGGGGGPSD
jgi:hypothetical protein